MPNVVIATTMWSKVDKDEGEQREAELKNKFWAEVRADGCKTERFENTYQSAWDIIDRPAAIDGTCPCISIEKAGNYTNEAMLKRGELEAFTSSLRGIFSR